MEESPAEAPAVYIVDDEPATRAALRYFLGALRLRTEVFDSLATFRRNGAAVETPVWCATLGGTLYVVTDGTSAKVRRIRATKRVRVAACNVSGRVRGEWFDGKGRVVSDRKLVARAHAALQRKYGWQMWLLDAGSMLFGRIGRRPYLELSLG